MTLFLFAALIAASSNQPTAIETSLVQNIETGNETGAVTALQAKAAFYRIPFVLTKGLNQIAQFFILRSIVIILDALSIWLSYKISNIIFNDEKFMPLMLPALLALSPFFFKISQIAGGQIIDITLSAIFFYSIMYFVKEKSYYYLVFPITIYYFLHILNPELSMIAFLPLLVSSLLLFIYKKYYLAIDLFNKKSLIIFLIGIISIFFLLTYTQNQFYKQLLTNLRAIIRPSVISHLLAQNIRTYILTPTPVHVVLNTLILAVSALSSIGLLIALLHPLYSRIDIGSDYQRDSMNNVFSISLRKRGDIKELLTPLQLFFLGIFSFSFFILFITGNARFAGFFNVVTIPLMIVPALTLLLFGLYSLKVYGMDRLSKISILSIFFFMFFTRLMT